MKVAYIMALTSVETLMTISITGEFGKNDLLPLTLYLHYRGRS
jgi:hypothetical protein